MLWMWFCYELWIHVLAIPYSFNSVQWRQRVTQWLPLIIALMTWLRWRVFPRDQSRTSVIQQMGMCSTTRLKRITQVMPAQCVLFGSHTLCFHQHFEIDYYLIDRQLTENFLKQKGKVKYLLLHCSEKYLKVYGPITYGFIHRNGVFVIRWKPLFFSLRLWNFTCNRCCL